MLNYFRIAPESYRLVLKNPMEEPEQVRKRIRPFAGVDTPDHPVRSGRSLCGSRITAKPGRQTQPGF